jgi:site-specific DNA-cytosine methylase
VSAPKLLDLYCGAGGLSVGYARSGFDVYGVDLDESALGVYPFASNRGNALRVMARLLAGWPVEFVHRNGSVEALRLADFDAGAGSPPCQASTALTKGTNRGREYPQLIPVTRRFFARAGLPSVLENVQGSDLRRDLTLCGEMFGLAVIRHRYFELGGWTAVQPAHKPHRGRVAGMRHGEWFTGPYFAVYGEGGGKGTVAQWQAAMGIDWTDERRHIAEAVPPAYAEWIGTQLMQHLRAMAA